MKAAFRGLPRRVYVWIVVGSVVVVSPGVVLLWGQARTVMRSEHLLRLACESSGLSPPSPAFRRFVDSLDDRELDRLLSHVRLHADLDRRSVLIGRLTDLAFERARLPYWRAALAFDEDRWGRPWLTTGVFAVCFPLEVSGPTLAEMIEDPQSLIASRTVSLRDLVIHVAEALAETEPQDLPQYSFAIEPPRESSDLTGWRFFWYNVLLDALYGRVSEADLVTVIPTELRAQLTREDPYVSELVQRQCPNWSPRSGEP